MIIYIYYINMIVYIYIYMIIYVRACTIVYCIPRPQTLPQRPSEKIVAIAYTTFSPSNIRHTLWVVVVHCISPARRRAQIRTAMDQLSLCGCSDLLQLLTWLQAIYVCQNGKRLQNCPFLFPAFRLSSDNTVSLQGMVCEVSEAQQLTSRNTTSSVSGTSPSPRSA
jgi:hypothetical protein